VRDGCYSCPIANVAGSSASRGPTLLSTRIVQRLRQSYATALALTLLACEQPRSNPAEHAVASAESSQGIRRFVAFREPTVRIASLETPMAPPVAVGSTLAGDLLSSSDPDVVSIDASGNLIAHKNGSTVVRTNSGATLRVIVNAIAVLQVAPDHLEMVGGRTASVRIVGDGSELPAGSYHWETTNPNTAMASASTVHAGYTPGTATLTVRSGNATSTLKVVVLEPRKATRSGR
jgi:hypothetical protein